MRAKQKTLEIVVLSVLMVLTLGVGGCKDPRTPQVIAAFNGFARACEAKDPGAAKLLCESSAEYYARIKQLAQTATKQQLKARPRPEIVDVLILRGTVEPKVLSKLDGRGAFAELVKSGAYVDYGELEARSATFQGKTTALTKLHVSDVAKGITMELRLEGDSWCVDLQSADTEIDQRRNSILHSFGVNIEEEVLIAKLVAYRLGAAFDKDWWNPPAP